MKNVSGVAALLLGCAVLLGGVGCGPVVRDVQAAHAKAGPTIRALAAGAASVVNRLYVESGRPALETPLGEALAYTILGLQDIEEGVTINNVILTGFGLGKAIDAIVDVVNLLEHEPTLLAAAKVALGIVMDIAKLYEEVTK